MNVADYRNIPYEKRDLCMICEKRVLDPLIEMPDFPLTEVYVKTRSQEKLGHVDQVFQFCPNCLHGQIANVIDPGLQYGDTDTYYFRTGQSVSGRETTAFFLDFVKRVIGNRTFGTTIEVGCNDLHLLKSLRFCSDKRIGIDPILKGHENEFLKDNIIAIGEFFENVHLDDPAHLVICKDTLEHVPRPKQFLKKVVDKGSNDTVFILQFPLLERLLSDCRFDQLFHQHLNYFSLGSILYMLDELGCGLLDYAINDNHWGAILIAFKKGVDNSKYRNKIWQITPPTVIQRYKNFRADMELASERLEFFRNEVIYGYGAALMLPILSYHMENDLSCLKCVMDDDESKDGLYYINLPVPVTHRSKIEDIAGSVILLTAIFSKLIVRRLLANLFPLNPKHIIYPLKTI